MIDGCFSQSQTGHLNPTALIAGIPGPGPGIAVLDTFLALAPEAHPRRKKENLMAAYFR
jgi:hypothetical protein